MDWFQEPFFNAVASGDEAAVNRLLSLGASLNKPDEKGLTALHWAASSPEAEVLVPLLLSRGSKIDARDELGRTALHVHCARGRVFGVGCLLHQGADANCQTLDTLSTPLHLAAIHNQTEIARLLLAYGAKSSVLNSAGERARDIGLADLS